MRAFRVILSEFLGALADLETAFDFHDVAFHALEGSLKEKDAINLQHVLASYRPRQILELGGYLGLSTRFLLECSDARVVSVDPNLQHRLFEWPQSFARTFNRGFVPERLEMISAFFAQPEYDRSWFRQFNQTVDAEEIEERLMRVPIVDLAARTGEFDLIYLDANHDFHSMAAYYEKVVQLLREGGVIVFHDVVSWPSVHQFAEQLTAHGANVQILVGRDGLGVVTAPLTRSSVRPTRALT